MFTHHPSQDIHELINRSQGGGILDEDNVLAVCRPCHTWITVHPEKAQDLGLHLPSWATEEMFEEARTLREMWARGEMPVASWRDSTK